MLGYKRSFDRYHAVSLSTDILSNIIWVFFHLGMLKSLLTPSPNAEHHLTMKGRWRIHVYWLVISNTFWLPDDFKSGQTHHQPDSIAYWGISNCISHLWCPARLNYERSHDVTARFPLKSNACRKQLADTSSIFQKGYNWYQFISITSWFPLQGIPWCQAACSSGMVVHIPSELP
jgi:hypothetical protein